MEIKMNEVEIAHIYKDSENNTFCIQTIEEHKVGTEEFANKFGFDFKCQSWAKAIASLHDIGKYSKEFQNYIRIRSGYSEDTVAHRVDHSSAGAILCKTMYPNVYPILAHCIAGHHSGLLNHQDLQERLAKQLSPDIPHFDMREDLTPPLGISKSNIHHWIRMLYSCLVDADYLDTERFMNKNHFILRENNTNILDLKKKLDIHLSKLSQSSSRSTLNDLRNQIQEECRNAAYIGEDIYSLTVPTGGGKTISSIVWAMEHAIRFNKKRIIIAIPYTSIIVQTAKVYRDIFGDENVLEHHSNFEGKDFQKLASENWDAPIVVTTNVQLFESLFSNKSSSCRKLHNLCNSVIILDEVQMLPVTLLNPILDAIKTLHELFGASILFTTASQPAIIGEIGSNRAVFTGLKHLHEIISDTEKLSQKLRRAKITIRNEAQNYEEIAGELEKQHHVLCIVNTRNEAKVIYNYMPKDGSTVHLSRMMCSAHILQTITEIKEHLKNKTKIPLRVIATQLIEAGVDIDFPTVYRSIAGLDSVVQAAGRCNREGKLNGLGEVIVFKGEFNTPQGFITKGKNALNELTHLNPDIDLLSPQAMQKYFSLLYNIGINSFDTANIKELLCEPPCFLFADAANAFKMIDDNCTPIIVTWGKGIDYIDELKKQGADRYLLRKMQNYSVSIREKDFMELVRMGRIEQIDGVWIQNDPNLYDKHIGLMMDNKWLNETYIL